MESVFKAINHKKTGEHEMQEAQLPAFQSEKVVRAAKILAIQYAVDRGTYRLALEGGFHVDVTKVWVNKRSPHVGGYFVQYQDGFSSFSPAAPFEKSYVPMGRDGAIGSTAPEPEGPATSGPDQPPPLPSAADLDAVAQEQAAAAATSAAPEKSYVPMGRDGAIGSTAPEPEGPATSGPDQPPPLPSAADLDAVAQEQAAAAATSAAPAQAESE